MSFISKLLRKTEPLTTATGVTAPLDARALMDEPAGQPEDSSRAPGGRPSRRDPRR